MFHEQWFMRLVPGLATWFKTPLQSMYLRMRSGATKSLGAIVAAAYLAGCAADIPGPILADGSGPMYDTKNHRIAPGSSQDPLFEKRHLAAGDVVYSTLIYGGYRNDQNLYLPHSLTERIPLRFVIEKHSDSALIDAERQFLFSTLVAARDELLQPVLDFRGCRNELTKLLDQHEKKLWNVFVASLYVKREAAIDNGTSALNVFISREELDAALLSILDKIKVPAPHNCKAEHFLRDQGKNNDILISAIATPAARSIASSIFQYNQDSGDTSSKTAFLLGGEIFSRSAVTQVEFSGVNSADPAGLERRWSLADWEASGICGDGKRLSKALGTPTFKIKYVRLRTGHGLLSDGLYRIDPDDVAQFQVAFKFEGDYAQRFLKGERSSLWATLGKSSLKSLTMADVTALSWELNGKPVSLANCKGR